MIDILSCVARVSQCRALPAPSPSLGVTVATTESQLIQVICRLVKLFLSCRVLVPCERAPI